MLISLFRVHGALFSWHLATVRAHALNVRYEGNSGHRKLRASRQLLTHFEYWD
jgi:hypothetical protein